MSEKYVLYDIPSKGGFAWSPNVWKARFILNYKKLPYQTQWVEFPDIAPTFKELGITANPEGEWAEYTVPALRLPDGTYLMHSSAILQKLEESHPLPSLRLDAGFHDQAQAAFRGVAAPLFPYFMPQVRRNLLRDESAEWFKADRERRSGMLEAEWEKGGDAAWTAAEPAIKRMSDLLKMNKIDEGPFILGSEPSFGDFIIAGFIHMFACIGPAAYERLVGYDPVLRDLYTACGPWLKQDS